jgi:membrane dipeptidase
LRTGGDATCYLCAANCWLPLHALLHHQERLLVPRGRVRIVEMMKPRLISKEHAKVVADAGGVVGVWTKLADSLKEFVESIKAMVDAVGIDHVGIGTDTDLLSSREGQGTNKAYPGLSGGFFPVVVGAMLLQGFTPDDISKVGGGNYCRVFGKVMAGHA